MRIGTLETGLEREGSEMGFYRDADIERAAFAAEAAHAAALREAGVCTHGATQGYTEKYRPDLALDKVECLECGAQWDSFEAYYAARREMLE